MRHRIFAHLSAAFLLLPCAASVCLLSGCGDSNETGTVVAKPKEADEGERKSMEGMKNMMKNKFQSKQQ